MKAKLKKTGEIVNVEDLFDDGTALANGCYIKVSNLDFIDTINWEQIRVNAAIAAMQNLCGCERFWSYPEEDIAKYSVRYADALIEELKKTM